MTECNHRRQLHHGVKMPCASCSPTALVRMFDTLYRRLPTADGAVWVIDQ